MTTAIENTEQAEPTPVELAERQRHIESIVFKLALIFQMYNISAPLKILWNITRLLTTNHL